MKDLKPLIKLALSVGLAILAAYFLISLADLSELGALVSDTRPVWLLCALLVYFLSLCARGFRLLFLYPEEPDYGWHVRTVSVAAVMNFLLPARLGEFSLVALVSRRLKLGIGGVALSVLAIRVQELICTLVISAALLLFSGRSTVEVLLGMVQPGLGRATLIGLGSLMVLGAAWGRYSQHRVYSRLRAQMKDWRIWGYSALVSFSMFALLFSIAKWLNIADALAVTPLIFLIALMVSFLPVNGIASVGGYHLAWALPLMAMGYESDLAVSLSILAHLGASAMVGAAALLVLGVDLQRLKSETFQSGQTESRKPGS